MGNENLIDKIRSTTKHLIYKIALSFYLWSIGYKTLEEYITEIERQYELTKTYEQK